MARIRTIKPEFFTSEDIVSLSPLARLLYVALWCEADKEGRLVWKPLTFKLRYLPADDCDIKALCQEIIDRGLVTLYGEGYAVIPAFAAHQHINPRESASQLPEPVANVTRKSRVGTRQARVGTGANLDVHAQGGREGKGKEGNDDPRVDDATGFDAFWTCWPQNERKQDKAKCSEKWKRDGLDAVGGAIVADVTAKKASQKWRDGFIEAPVVYLNNRRWEDGAAGSATGPKRGSEEYAALHRNAAWWRDAGFESVWDAINAKCWHDNADKFSGGQRVEVAA
jgi:hypothetical protein